MSDWHEKMGVFLRTFLFPLLEDVTWGQVAYVGYWGKIPLNPTPVAYVTLRKGMFVKKFSEQHRSLDFESKQLTT